MRWVDLKQLRLENEEKKGVLALKYRICVCQLSNQTLGIFIGARLIGSSFLEQEKWLSSISTDVCEARPQSKLGSSYSTYTK